MHELVEVLLAAGAGVRQTGRPAATRCRTVDPLPSYIPEIVRRIPPTTMASVSNELIGINAAAINGFIRPDTAKPTAKRL